MARAKNRLKLTHEGGRVWTYEVNQAKEQEKLTTLEMLKVFRDELTHIIQMMEEEANKWKEKEKKRNAKAK